MGKKIQRQVFYKSTESYEEVPYKKPKNIPHYMRERDMETIQDAFHYAVMISIEREEPLNFHKTMRSSSLASSLEEDLENLRYLIGEDSFFKNSQESLLNDRLRPYVERLWSHLKKETPKKKKQRRFHEKKALTRKDLEDPSWKNRHLYSESYSKPHKNRYRSLVVKSVLRQKNFPSWVGEYTHEEVENDWNQCSKIPYHHREFLHKNISNSVLVNEHGKILTGKDLQHVENFIETKGERKGTKRKSSNYSPKIIPYCFGHNLEQKKFLSTLDELFSPEIPLENEIDDDSQNQSDFESSIGHQISAKMIHQLSKKKIQTDPSRWRHRNKGKLNNWKEYRKTQYKSS